jgi:hypothetical protein
VPGSCSGCAGCVDQGDSWLADLDARQVSPYEG